MVYLFSLRFEDDAGFDIPITEGDSRGARFIPDRGSAARSLSCALLHELTAQMVGANAGLHANQAWRHACETNHDLAEGRTSPSISIRLFATSAAGRNGLNADMAGPLLTHSKQPGTSGR